MKNVIFLSLLLLSIVACNSKNNQTDSVTTKSTTTVPPADSTAAKKAVAELYACPMHPEVTGEKDSECSKCGMPLTEPLK